MKAHPITCFLALLVTSGLFIACSDYKSAGGEDPKVYLEQEAAMTVEHFRRTDPSLSKFFSSAAGYAVFPRVSKGAAGIGAAHGRGVLYEGGKVVGYTDVTQATLGAQLGGQVFSQIVFLEYPRNVEAYKRGEVEFAAQASAVAAANGAAANADYSQGTAVFTVGQEGLMFEAAIGGQQFSYKPKQ